MSDAIKALVAEIIQELRVHSKDVLVQVITDIHAADKPDPILSTKQAAKHMGLSTTKVRQLEALGHLKRCPGNKDLRFRRSILDAYGTADPNKNAA